MSSRTPVHLWIVGTLALLWSLGGVYDYLATQLELEGYMDQFDDDQLAYFYGFPAWLVAFWALGVWGSFAGAVGLLLRKRWAVWAFGISLLGLAVSTLYNFGLSNGAEIMGTFGVYFTLVLWIVTILLLWYSRKQAQNGVLT